MDATAIKVMRECNNYFAVLCERVSGAKIAATDVEAAFQGKYTPGMLIRLHGAFTSAWDGFGEGEVYKVVSFADGVLTLDRELHTIAPYLFIAYLEPPSEFLELCEEIAEFEIKAKGREGLASESIDGYSYSVATDPNGRTGYAAAFADKLKPYRNPKPTRLYYARNALQWQ